MTEELIAAQPIRPPSECRTGTPVSLSLCLANRRISYPPSCNNFLSVQFKSRKLTKPSNLGIIQDLMKHELKWVNQSMNPLFQTHSTRHFKHDIGVKNIYILVTIQERSLKNMDLNVEHGQ